MNHQEKHHRKIPVTENYTLTGLYPNTLYYVWLAARSQRGEGATTIPYPVRTKQFGKQNSATRNTRKQRGVPPTNKRNKQTDKQTGKQTRPIVKRAIHTPTYTYTDKPNGDDSE